MMQSELEYHITHKQLNDYMNKIFSEICSFDDSIVCKYMPFDADPSIGGRTIRDISHPVGAIGYLPVRVVIRNADVVLTSKGELTQDYEAFKIMHAAYHERRHVERLFDDFIKNNVPEEVKKLAKVHLIADYLPEYYEAGYNDNPCEIDAEYDAYKHLKLFCEKHNTGLDFEACAVRYVNESDVIRTKVHNLQEIDDVYKKALSNSYYQRRFRSDILEYKPRGEHLQKLLKDKELALKVLNADTGVQETEYLTEYIAKTAPDYFRWYSCIYDDYCPQPTIKGKTEHFTRKVLRIVPEEWNEMARQMDEDIGPDGPQP